MNDWLKQEKAAKAIKEEYKEGDKLLVNSVDDAVYSKYIGQVVTVRSIDDLGQIYCVAENGGTLRLCQFYGDSFEKFELKVVKREIDENGNELYVEWNDGSWAKGEFNDEGDRTYFENSNGEWERYEYDEDGNNTYIEDSTGFWVKYEYNEDGDETYYENSRGEWAKREYDDCGNITYHENSTGYKEGTPRAELERDKQLVLQENGNKYILNNLCFPCHNYEQLLQADNEGHCDVPCRIYLADAPSEIFEKFAIEQDGDNYFKDCFFIEATFGKDAPNERWQTSNWFLFYVTDEGETLLLDDSAQLLDAWDYVKNNYIKAFSDVEIDKAKLEQEPDFDIDK